MLRRQTVWRLGFGSAAAALSASLPVRISRHTCLIDFVRLALGVQEVLFSFGFYKTGMILDMYDWLHNTDSNSSQEFRIDYTLSFC